MSVSFLNTLYLGAGNQLPWQLKAWLMLILRVLAILWPRIKTVLLSDGQGKFSSPGLKSGDSRSVNASAVGSR